jgi:hypothetical protein
VEKSSTFASRSTRDHRGKQRITTERALETEKIGGIWRKKVLNVTRSRVTVVGDMSIKFILILT